MKLAQILYRKLAKILQKRNLQINVPQENVNTLILTHNDKVGCMQEIKVGSTIKDQSIQFTT